MDSVEHALDRYRRHPTPPVGRTDNPFQLASTLMGPASSNEIELAWRGRDVPPDALDLWAVCREARLFEDVDYGQWGLVLLSPAASSKRTEEERRARPTDLRADDVVLGEFLGDQELLVLAPSEDGDRRILIALPLDARSDWHGAAPNLRRFLEMYFDHVGEKYWESMHGGRGGPARRTGHDPIS